MTSYNITVNGITYQRECADRDAAQAETEWIAESVGLDVDALDPSQIRIERSEPLKNS